MALTTAKSGKISIPNSVGIVVPQQMQKVTEQERCTNSFRATSLSANQTHITLHSPVIHFYMPD